MKRYSGDYAQEIAFPLSGIGTGGISLSGIGELIDWELDGKANKNTRNQYTHFAIKAERNGNVIDARAIHGDKTTELGGSDLYSHNHSWGYGCGLDRLTLAGYPHFADTAFTGEFPFASMTFKDASMPANIRMEAFNPFIPGDEDNSSLPASFFRFEITNTAAEATDFTLAFSVGNPFSIKDGGFSTFWRENGLSSITLKSKNLAPEQPEYGELAVFTDCNDISYQEYWFRSDWFDDMTTFWREFSSFGRLKNRTYGDSDPRGQNNTCDTCTLEAHISLAPGEKKEIYFLLAWYFPNFVKYWDNGKPSWKHEYVRRFASAAEVGKYCFENREMLYGKSALFRDALMSMTLPEAVLDAVSANLCILKSVTCLRLENGEFWAFEGTKGHEGSCEGTCDHVWQYQYALPYLFPCFARQILETDYTYNMKDSGEMMFRTMLPLGAEKFRFRACADGQMGSVLRFYREWKLSGDDEWLKKWWGHVKKSIEYAWSPENQDRWDPEKTGVLWGRQHHTLDVELFGPNAWLTGFYLAALKAGAEMAEYLGDAEKAKEYSEIFRKGQKFVEAELFNGRHYIQKIDIKDRSILDPYAGNNNYVYSYWNDETGEIKYQIGEGCEIDQLVAQWHSTLIGLGDVFDPTQRKTALRALYEINFRSMREISNPCRIFAVNGESGMIICAWRDASHKPSIPIPYTEECMTGFEYAAAGLMIQEGLVSEGIEIINAVRDRYDGKKRNPYSEIECGASYARAMASFALPAAFSGYICDMRKGEIGFRPVLFDRRHKTFFSCDGVWGTAEIGKHAVRLDIADGRISLNSFIMPSADDARRITLVTADDENVPFTRDGDKIVFAQKVTVRQALELR